MTEMTPARWANTCAYVNEVFGREDEQLRTMMRRAVDAGLPDIAVDAAVGRLLALLVSTTNGGRGARLALELGTLAGYSGVWIARALAPGGRLVTLEPEPKHAAFARREFDAAGVGARVQVREAKALDEMPRLRREFGDGAFDFIFLDALKAEYPAYFEHAREMAAPGGLVVADNALGGGWWIDDAPGTNESRDAVDAFNRMVAADARFDSCCVPVREGLTIARRVG